MGDRTANRGAVRDGRVATIGAPSLGIVGNGHSPNGHSVNGHGTMSGLLREAASRIEAVEDLYRSALEGLARSDFSKKVGRNAVSIMEDLETFGEFARHFTSFEAPFVLNEARFPLEVKELLSSRILKNGNGLPHGNGEPVAFFPGFLAGDFEFVFIKSFYEMLNYDVRFFGIKSNIDSTRDTEEMVGRKLEKIYNETGKRVLIVGHSRGGTQGLLLGLEGSEHLELIRGVMTMGSPIRPPFGFTRTILLAALPIGLGNGLIHGVNDIRRKIRAGMKLDVPEVALIMAVGGFHNIHRELESARRLKNGAAGVPLVTLSSRSDGVVEFAATTRKDASLPLEVENCSHLGFAANPRSFVAQAEGAHKIFSGELDAKSVRRR